MKSLLNGRVQLHAGDCLAILPTLAENSVDSCVVDPPYHLTSMVKRFANAKAENEDFAMNKSNSGYMSRGFMNQKWDGGDIAFRPETWAAVLRVLKPGGHLVAFAAPKNAHRMVCAIEDAGFEIRDTLMWIFGSGFPKSLDVSKAIDKAAGAEREVVGRKANLHSRGNHKMQDGWHRPWMDNPEAVERGMSETAPATDAARQWEGWGTALKPSYEPVALCRKPLSEPTIAANVLRWGTGALNIAACRVGTDTITVGVREQRFKGTHYANGEEYRPAFVGETQHEGRWPANVIHDGSEEVVGAFPESSVTGNRSERSQAAEVSGTNWLSNNHKSSEHLDSGSAARFFKSCSFTEEEQVQRAGRWPANVIHDGSEEVVGAFPERKSAGHYQDAEGDSVAKPVSGTNVFVGRDAYNKDARRRVAAYSGEEGSAARFFYTAKADSDDRLGSKHPTVKPLDLIQYLVRLVTPPKGVVLDCFAGTGTTGEAAWREGFSAVLIEREPEYLADIERRMSLALAGPDERARESIKARLKGKPVDAGPLFAPVEKPRRQVVCPECNGNPPFEKGASGWGCETCWSHGYILVEAAEEPLFGAIA